MNWKNLLKFVCTFQVSMAILVGNFWTVSPRMSPRGLTWKKLFWDGCFFNGGSFLVPWVPKPQNQNERKLVFLLFFGSGTQGSFLAAAESITRTNFLLLLRSWSVSLKEQIYWDILFQATSKPEYVGKTESSNIKSIKAENPMSWSCSYAKKYYPL